MLTNRLKKMQEETGLIHPDRLRSLQVALRAMADDSWHAARREGIDDRLGASFRGKRLGYLEASRMVEAILNNHAMHPRSWSTAKAKARAAHQRGLERILRESRETEAQNNG